MMTCSTSWIASDLSLIELVVVLPAPFGPKNPVICPGNKSSDRLSISVFPLIIFVNFLIQQLVLTLHFTFSFVTYFIQLTAS